MDLERIYTIAERIAEIEYLKRGYEVSHPSGKSRYDFIAEKDGRCVRVQVKSGTPFNNGKELLGHSPRGYLRNEIDVMVIVDLDNNGNCYFIPCDHIEGQTNVRIRLDDNGYQGKALSGKHYTRFIG